MTSISRCDFRHAVQFTRNGRVLPYDYRLEMRARVLLADWGLARGAVEFSDVIVEHGDFDHVASYGMEFAGPYTGVETPSRDTELKGRGRIGDEVLIGCEEWSEVPKVEAGT